ncbi:hypothetical protein [Methylosinus sporium]|uniref:hypothetical protein n=1 Tax=Methylosinus sporium TaxID=428 RepID=UPI00383B7891
MTVAIDFVAALVGLKPSRRCDKIETPRVQQTPAGIHLIFAGRYPNKRGQLSSTFRRRINISAATREFR